MISQLQFISQESPQQSHLQSIEEACKAGIKWVQLRVKDKSETEVYSIAREAKAVCGKYDVRLIINDYPVVAKAVDAYGVHVGKEDMPVATVRAIVGKQLIVGATANTFEDIKKHYKDGADYIGLGPFQFTATKKKLSPVLGMEGYRRILRRCLAANIPLPVIAIGGIGLDHIEGILQTGVHGIAVSSLIAMAENKKEVIDHIHTYFLTIQ